MNNAGRWLTGSVDAQPLLNWCRVAAADGTANSAITSPTPPSSLPTEMPHRLSTIWRVT